MSDAAAMRLWRFGGWRGRWLHAAIGVLAFLGAAAPEARASPEGYEPASPATIAVQGELPQQVAIDQTSQTIYVAIPVTHIGTSPGEVQLGQIDQLTAAGTATAASPFAANQNRVFAGVAVNPATQGIYAAEMSIETPLGPFGTAGRIDQFSSTGTAGTEFSTGGQINEGPRIAADSSGRVFVPSPASGTVKVYNSAGSLQESIACGGCEGGSFQRPIVAALNSAGDLYVVDSGADEVVKLTHSGGPYVYASTLQSGKRAAAVGIDPSTDSVFVGDYPAGGYHIVAYNSAGVKFDDFGAHLFGVVEFGAEAAGQIAVNATTHRLYASDPGSNELQVFDRVTINPPTATANPADPVGQLEATMKGTVNANYHATSVCHFEYADDAYFQSNEFSGSSQLPCSMLPDGSGSTSVNADVGSLTPTTTYHYRVVAANDAGTTTSGAVEFTTLPVTLPTVSTEMASGVTDSAANMRGKVNPHGGTVSACKFEYGATESYGKTTTCPGGAIGITSADVSKSAHLSGLLPATAYHYRFSVTTNAGPAHGADVEFTTAAPPPPEEPAPEEGGSGESPQGGGSTTLPPPTTTPPISTPRKPLRCRKGFRKRRVHGKPRCVRKKHRKHKRAHRKHKRHHRRAH